MKNNGFSMVEVIVSIGIASMVVLGFTYINIQNIRISQHNILNLQANLYAMEAMEVTKDLEISNWSEFDNCVNKCYPKIDEGLWTFENGQEDIAGEGVFTRWIEVEDNSNFFESKKITATVEWSDFLKTDQSIKVETYVFNIN
jgi:prepilin-type N-terminal cleavage/methylation domain-containing protein